MNYTNEKRVNPLVITAIIVAVLLMLAGAFAFLNMKCVFGHAYTNGVCDRCACACVHENIEADGICAECALTVGVENSTPNENQEEIPGAVNTATGEALVSGQAYAITNMAFTRASAMSATATEGITITAFITPEYATNKAVDWYISFVNPSSEWATGKAVTDYVTIAPVSDGSLDCVVTCLAPFGEQIKITVISRDNPQATSSIMVDYLQTFESIQMKIGDIVLTPGDNYIEDFVIESGKTGPGGEVSIEYVGGDTYTLAFEELSYGTWFLDYDLEDSGKDESFYYTFDAYNMTTNQYETVRSSWALDLSMAENPDDYTTITFDVDWFISRYGVYCDVPMIGADIGYGEDSVCYDKTMRATSYLKDVSLDFRKEMFNSAIENGTDVVLQFNVPVSYWGHTPSHFYFTVHVGSIAEIGVESVEIGSEDITFGGE